MFTFGSIVILISGFLIDHFGRVKLIIVCYTLVLLGNIFSIFSSSLFYIIAGNVITWAAIDLFNSSVVIYSNEISTG